VARLNERPGTVSRVASSTAGRRRNECGLEGTRSAKVEVAITGIANARCKHAFKLDATGVKRPPNLDMQGMVSANHRRRTVALAGEPRPHKNATPSAVEFIGARGGTWPGCCGQDPPLLP
jgi:hypothetical protein